MTASDAVPLTAPSVPVMDEGTSVLVGGFVVVLRSLWDVPALLVKVTGKGVRGYQSCARLSAAAVFESRDAAEDARALLCRFLVGGPSPVVVPVCELWGLGDTGWAFEFDEVVGSLLPV